MIVAKKKKAAPALRCPTNIKADDKKKGLCYSVERVQRNSHKGYITAFHSRSSGRAAGFSGAPGACKRTMDPFQASIRKSKADAEKVGQQCARASVTKR
jgi:hypothetical protein